METRRLSRKRSQDVQTRHVLCVDDDEWIGLLVRMALEPHGYTVTVVPDGEQAWELLNASGADLLLTDQRMPRLTGMDLARRVRAAGWRLPIIMLSGVLDLLDREQLRELELAAVLAKPFSEDRLVAAVEGALTG